jgi:uncharacterized ubiquitin-like protein YukD
VTVKYRIYIGYMKLSIKSLKGEKVSISVSEESQVSALKREVAVEFGIEEDKIKLIFKGRILKDDNTIKDYGMFLYRCLSHSICASRYCRRKPTLLIAFPGLLRQ